MSAMSDYRASSGSLTSPSPSSPSPPPPRKLPSPSKVAGLDSSSELSELTEDEQDASHASTHSDTPQDSRRGTRKKRGGIVPAPMWDWAYKPPGRKAADSEEPTSAVSKNSNHNHAPSASARSSKGPDADDDEQQDDNGDGVSLVGKIPSPQPESDAEDGGERLVEPESEDEIVDNAQNASAPLASLSGFQRDSRESSPAPTEDDDFVEPGVFNVDQSVFGIESDWSDVSSVIDEVAPDGDEDGAPKNADTAPVVPLAPASSSIMAGQQLIKTPSASPSTSPEPEEEAGLVPDRGGSFGSPPEKTVKTEPAEPEASADVDCDNDNDNDNDEDTGNADQVDLDADPDADVEAEVEAEAEEAELDMQPAHRAEALDVLAQIELRFALVREALYVEKMEDLAVEEAMVLQGIHPEMTHLQTELQVRHDRRLELAAKRRRCEDNHVSLMHKGDEEAVWSWWKYERDDLQTELFAEANRKRRRLEREKRILDRAPPARRIPLPPSARTPQKPISVRELVKFASLDTNQYPSKLKRKRKDPPGQGYTYPSLAVLSTQDIQNDLQILTAPRARTYHAPVMGEIGPGMGLAPPYDQHFIDYNAPPGIGMPPPGHAPFGHGLPPAPMTVHHAYPPPPPPNNGRVYHHQQPNPPMGVVHPNHPNARMMQGPGAPPPSAMGGYHPHGGRLRRSPSPPPMPGYEHRMSNGAPPYGTSGPGQHWAPVPPSTSAGAGPSKQQPAVNGYGKDHHKRPSSSKDGQVFDGRERDGRADRERERERAGMWHENGIKDLQDEHGRNHTQHGAPLQQHRHAPMHQSLQGVPHHHHVVHHRHNAHHHHPPPSRAGPSQHPMARPHELERHMSGPEHEPPSRHPPPTIEQINLVPKSSPYWKDDPEPRDRDRGRIALIAPAPPPMAQLGPPPDRDRPQVTPFVMTPSQAMQAGFPPRAGEGNTGPGRRESWMDDGAHGHGRARYDHSEYSQGPPLPLDGPAQLAHAHSHQGANGVGVGSPRLRNGISMSTPPPPTTGPGGAYPTHLQSPTRIPLGSAHPSPLGGTSGLTPKGPGVRPISPLPAKVLPPASYTSGPGTPGAAGSRLGTPGLAGPGTRPDGLPNGHGHGLGLGLGHVHNAGLYAGAAGLSGPAQPLLPPSNTDPAHLVPPKMTAVQLGNGT
ncbi:hypothetical protein DFH11DRAFT_389972 [Phellopilus nigrolimitatus]|nr:hypothetical protein DFH11DRAFT_389972 [Phellopilus nigrolimitatus]